MIGKMIREITDRISFGRLRKNILFTLSGLAFCLLIFQITKIWILMMGAAFVASVGFALFFGDIRERFRESNKGIRTASRVIAFILAAACAVKFVFYFTPSSKMGYLADSVGMDKLAVLIIIASVIALVTLYFLTLTSALVLCEIRKILTDTLIFSDYSEAVGNIKKNRFYLISALVFMLISSRPDLFGAIATGLSFVLITFIFSQVTGIKEKVGDAFKGVRILSFVSALGVCCFSEIMFAENFGGHIIMHIVSVILAVVSLYAVYSVTVLLFKYTAERLCPLWKSLKKAEIGIYILIVLAFCSFVFYAFRGSNAFWGTDLKYDIIYTSDSADLLSTNVFMRLCHSENDLRQPLFAAFSMPFVSFGYIVGLPLSLISEAFLPMCMNFAQIVMFVVANIMLARIMKLDSLLRVLFVIFISSSYFSLLFSVMMEQYIVAYFWLVFALYVYSEKKQIRKFDLYAAGGTLLTSLVIMPMAFEKKKENVFVSIVRDAEKILLGFVVMVFALGRLDFIFDLSYKAKILAEFAGGTSFVGRIRQYVSFVSSCFVAPETMIDNGQRYGHISLQLSDNTAFVWDVAGIVILALCALALILDRKNKFTQICALWAGFSVILLVLVGWGSVENGMILYGLYFGWAFAVLIFRLFVRISEIIRFRYLAPVLASGAVAYMGIMNYEGIKDLLSFAFTHYPF